MRLPQVNQSNKISVEIADTGHDSPGCSLKLQCSGSPPDELGGCGVAPDRLTNKPAHLPDPWLFDSEALIREIDRIRETALQVPTSGDSNATHFGLQMVVNAAWTLRENLRYLLHLHREGQRSVRRQHEHSEGIKPQHQTIYDLAIVVKLARNKLLITLWTGYLTP
jgi:hypothetical protein